MDGRPRLASALGVRSRQTFRGDGEPILELGVLCPSRTRDVPLEECVRCRDCLGLRVDSADNELVVVCDADPQEPQPPKTAEGDRGTPRAADQTPISSIMTTRVVCVGPTLTVNALATVFLDAGISGAPVVDDAGHPVGIVSKTDLVREHYRPELSLSRERVVSDIMMPMAFCLPANESVAKAAALMAFEGMHRVPVVNAHGEVVGLVSPLDIMRWMARQHGYVLGRGAHESAR